MRVEADVGVVPLVTTHVAFEAARDLVRERVLLFPWTEGRIRDVAALRRN